VEAVIVLFLEWLEHKNRDRIMQFILKCYKHYQKIHIVFEVIGAILLITAIWLILPLLKSSAGKPEVTVFAGVILFVITLLYFMLTHIKGRLAIKKRGDRVLYIVLSIILFFFVLILADQKLPDYRRYVYQNVLSPSMAAVEKKVEVSKEEKLLNMFRERVRNGKCPFKDYGKEKDPSIIHNFVYITTDPEFKATAAPASEEEPSSTIKGKNCTAGVDTFLLTEYGSWYRVIDTLKR
jgi:hypothetical protein